MEGRQITNRHGTDEEMQKARWNEDMTAEFSDEMLAKYARMVSSKDGNRASRDSKKKRKKKKKKGGRKREL